MLHLGPFVTRNIPGIGGEIKRFPGDFRVTELLARNVDRTGAWVLASVEKTNRTSFEMVQILANQLQVDQRAVSLAGMKDARAITRQFVALEGVAPEAVEAIQMPNLRVLSVSTTDAPLRYGEHRGNRFDVRIRGADRSREKHLLEILYQLDRKGVPNFYGPQRFGSKYEGAFAGRGLLHQDFEETVFCLLAWHGGNSNNRCAKARRLFSKGDWRGALDAWPRRMFEKRRMLSRLLETKGDYRSAVESLPNRLKRLYLMGYQSHVFNLYLTVRLESYSQVLEGDLSLDVAGWGPKPTGPIFGPEMPLPSGAVLDLEMQILEQEGLSLHQPLNGSGNGMPIHGSRRPLAALARDMAYRWDGSDLLLSFTLPPGAYATGLLGEVIKPRVRGGFGKRGSSFIGGNGGLLETSGQRSS